MSIAKKLIVNFFHLFSASVIGQLLFLCGLVHVAREVGPAEFGLWNLALVWMMFLFRLGEMGMDLVGMRNIASKPSDMSQTVWNIIIVRFVIAILLILCVLLCVWFEWAPNGSGSLFVIFSLSLIPLAFTLEWVFEGVQSVKIVGVARIVRGGLFAALVWLFISGEGQIREAAAFYVITFSLGSLIVLIAALVKFELVKPSFDWKKAKILLAQSFPIGMAAVLTQYSLFVGTIIIGFLLQPTDLGFYSAAHRLVIFIWVYGIVTSSRVLLPQLSRLFDNSTIEYSQFVRRVWRIFVLAALPVGMIIILNAQQIVSLLYGPSYHESSSVLQILSAALVIAIFRSVIETSFIATNKQANYLYGMAGAAAFYTIFTFVGVHLWGIEGAAWAAVITEFCYAAFLVVNSSDVGKFTVTVTVLRSFVAAGVSMLVLMAFHISSIFFNVISSVALYGLLLLIMKEFTLQELRSHLEKVLSPNQ